MTTEASRSSRLDYLWRMARRFIHAFTWFLVATMISSGGLTAASIEEAVKGIYSSGEYQEDLPNELDRTFGRELSPITLGENRDEEQIIEESGPSEDDEETLEDADDTDSFTFKGILGGETSLDSVIVALLWILIAGLALLLVFYLFRELPFMFRRAAREPVVADALPGGQPISIDTQSDLLGRADQLAADGNFRDAVRLLVLRAVEVLIGHIDFALRPSLTNRELLSKAKLSEAAKTALATMVSAEELGQFGGKALNAAVYNRCRNDYRRFLQETGTGAL